ncbi:hypothetical protein PMZ80_003726 [Knufia obscura]|uniref:Uncharacterized protein n=1 Tax=Knufia obscura TaxID=1635080 RepID=A0ABR0RV13_9EURO|nr:hypothetical protein PMZ80_003726 [Knufia obscura]
MDGGRSNKPIVFVFGAKKGDVDGRKKNLSAINTQVAYRAHERRREKKSRQRAQAKEDGKVDQPTSSIDDTASASVKVENNVDFNHFVPETVLYQPKSLVTAEREPSVSRHLAAATNRYARAEVAHPAATINGNNHRRILNDRRESDLSSDASSDHDAVWSASPSSHRFSSPSTDLSGLSPSAPVQINGYFDKALDPFFRLPKPATDREQWLVHFYFREMGHIGFGTHTNSLFCPDRDWVSTYVSTKPLCFQWVLILAEEHLGRIGVLPDQTKTIERKSKAYGTLNAILKSKTADRDEGISGIMYAAIVDTGQTPLHLQALDRLINDTGGFEAFLDGPLGIAHPEHVATAFAFGPCPIPSLQDMEIIKGRFLDVLRTFHNSAKQEQEEKRRIRNRRPWDTLNRQTIDGNGNLVPADHDDHFRYYIKAQQDCLNTECLAPLLNATLNPQLDYTSQARHLAALVQTLMILREFEHNYLARAMFLKRLKHVAEMSTARDLSTGSARLSHAGLLLINSFVRQEVQTYFDRTRALAKGVRISKVVVDFLKICPLVQQPTRSLVVSWLRDWLCYNDQFEDAEFTQLQEKDLAVISAEITNAWFMSVGKGP